MARSSPSVKRVAALLNFIADHPGQSFTLTDLIRALKFSRATCHALLTGLVDVKYLYRASDKQYVLGPALVAIGRAAAEHASPLQVAQPEMRALADEFDGLCVAVARDGHDVVIVEHAASVSNLGQSLRPGSRLKLAPAFSAVFFAWSPLSDAEAWLDASKPPPTAEQRADMKRIMAFACKHGFAVFLNDNPMRRDQPSANEIATDQQRNFPVLLLTEIHPNQQYDLISISAPVFEREDKVALVLSMSGLTSPMKGKEIERIGRQLREACDRVSEYLMGRQLKPTRGEPEPGTPRGARSVRRPK